MALDPIKRNSELARIHRDMNIVHGTRVSWEYKQRYTDWLAKLTAEGHLTHDEYAARMEWVDASHTEQDLRVAFVDLPTLPLTPRPQPKRQRRPVCRWPESPYWMAGAATWELVLFILSIIAGNVTGIIIGGVFGAIFLVVAAKRFNDERGK